MGALDGILTVTYGNKDVRISFDESDVFVDDAEGVEGGKTAAEKMAEAINKKLEEATIAFDSGSQEKASERIKAEVVDGKITLSKVKDKDSNTMKISAVSGNLGEKLGIGTCDYELIKI